MIKKYVTIFIISLIMIISLNNVFCKEVEIKKNKTVNQIFNYNQEIGENGNQPSGFGESSNIAVRGQAIYNDELYIGTQNINLSQIKKINLRFFATISILAYKISEKFHLTNNILKIFNLAVPSHSIFSDGCEVWKYNNTKDEWSPFISDKFGALLSAGFGKKRNFATSIIIPFKGDLYLGTSASSLNGFEVYRYNSNKIELVGSNGFGNRFNSGAWSACEYNNELYIGTMNWNTGCEIWKSADGVNWTKVIIPNGDGFGTNYNVYAWNIKVYNNSLYVGTCNLNPEEGCQLWEYNGLQWKKVDLPGGDGFGQAGNYGVRNLIVYNNELYVATAQNFLYQEEAFEIWKYDGEKWTCIVGDNGIIDEGFSNSYNKYAWSMTIGSDNKLWVGTLNIKSLKDNIPFYTYGCEIWNYNGLNWQIIAGENPSAVIPGGFGNINNFGARSIIEYPTNSGNLYIGTWTSDVKMLENFEGCEVWKIQLYD